MLPEDFHNTIDVDGKEPPLRANSAANASKQPKLKRSSGSATVTTRPSISRKTSADYANTKGATTSTMRRAMSQDFVREDENALQRPSRPVQAPVQLPIQLPAGKAQLAALGTRKWLKIEASGATSIMQVDAPAL